MSIWTKQKLGDVVTFRTGKLNSNAAVANGKYPFFTCSQEIYKTNTYSFDTECVLLGGNNASAIYPIFYFDGKFDAYQRTYVIEPKKGDSTRFLYYALRKKLTELQKQSTGATTKFLTLKILKGIQIEIADAKTQALIASVLSTYDDLIENNEKRIKTLEEITQLLFTEWFVKFKFPGYEKIKMVDSATEYGKIPKGWEIKSFVESNIFLSCKDRVKKYEGTKLYFDTSCIDGIKITKEPLVVDFDTMPSRAQFSPVYNSVWFARMSNTYKVLVFDRSSEFEVNNYLLSSGMLGLKTEEKYLGFLFASIKSELFHQQKNSRATGATQVSLTDEGFAGIRILFPTLEMIEKYSNIVNGYIGQILILQRENTKLSQARNILIPQLVTGKRKLK